MSNTEYTNDLVDLSKLKIGDRITFRRLYSNAKMTRVINGFYCDRHDLPTVRAHGYLDFVVPGHTIREHHQKEAAA